jgi:RNA polymerase sigma-70 factor (ECF subfamily)
MTDAEPFETFVRTHQDLVFATAIRLLGTRRDAEDVAQTVFLKAFERFDQLAESPGAAAWLKTVTTNLCLNHLSRYRARWRFFSEMRRPSEGAGGDEDVNVSYEQTIAAPQPAPDITLVQADEHRRLVQALRTLPPHQRVPLVLFHFDRMSYQDIATRLGVSLAKVKTDIHRGREVLARLLG